MSEQHSLDRRLLNYLKPQMNLLVLGSICAVGVSAVTSSQAVLAKYTSKALIEKDHHLLIYCCWAVVAIYAGKWFLSLGQSILFGELGQRIGQTMRVDIYKHLQTLSLSYFDNQRTGNLLSVFGNDVPVVQNGIMSIKDMIASPVMAVIGLGGTLYISWRLTVILVLIMPFMAVAINIVTKKLRAIQLETQNRLGEVTTIAEETLAGARLVRAFGAEQREIGRFEKGVQATKDVTMTGIKRSAVLSPTTDFMGACGMALALLIGGNEVVHGMLTTDNLIAYVVFVNQLRVGIGGIGNIGVTWKQTLGAADRIFSGILDVPSEVNENPDAKPLDLRKGEVCFHGVGFGYRKDQTVLRNIGFKMNPGQVTAIVGPSGAGKSTLSDLIPRFYDPTAGYIEIDGQDIHCVTIDSLREQIGIVPQETIIFGGTVRDNINYGRPNATKEQVMDAARHANAHEFISALPNGYDSIVGERGVTLSGGQRQRIAIARALLKDPRILILDEATSSLDETSQILVQGALETLMHGRTTLVIAHRLSTIKNADLIVVMDEGRIVESGSHDMLIANNGAYARLYDTQFRGASNP